MLFNQLVPRPSIAAAPPRAASREVLGNAESAVNKEPARTWSRSCLNVCSIAPRASSGSRSFIVSATRSTRCARCEPAHVSRTQRRARVCKLRRRRALFVCWRGSTRSLGSSRIVVHSFKETGRCRLIPRERRHRRRTAGSHTHSRGQSRCPTDRACDASGHTRCTRRSLTLAGGEVCRLHGGDRRVTPEAPLFCPPSRCPRRKVGTGTPSVALPRRHPGALALWPGWPLDR